MALYEHVFIARQDISSQQVEGLIDMMQAVLEENDGKITKIEYWNSSIFSYSNCLTCSTTTFSIWSIAQNKI